MVSFLKRAILSAVRSAGYEIIKLSPPRAAAEAQPDAVPAPVATVEPAAAPPPEDAAPPSPPPVPAAPVKTLLDRWMDRTMMIAGVQAVRAQRPLQQINTLADVEVCVFSQFGEDGILDWLVAQLPISRPVFIEIGVGNYLESNTRFLLRHRNWRGLIIDGAPEIAQLKTDDVSWAHDLTAVSAFVTAENVSSIIKSAGFDTPVGILSIDIDGVDYWVLKQLLWLKPDIIICEYNAVMGDLYPMTIPYNPEFDRRTVPGASRLYYGASIQAFVSLLQGYTLAGTAVAGGNAFFVRNEIFGAIAARIADTYPRPSLFRESYGPDGRLTFIGGLDRLAQITSQPVVDLRTGQVTSIGALGNPYSERWLHQMGR
jgi:hypothetical protein